MTDITEKSNEVLRKSETYTSVNFVDIDLNKILKYDEFSLQLGEKAIPIMKERIDGRGINNYVFVGSNRKGCRVLISVLDDDIQGVIESNEEVFTIKTVGKQQYALVTYDYSKLREACDDLQEEKVCSVSDEANSNSNEESSDAITSSPILTAATAYDCKIRVLVLYTPSAQSSVSNIKNTVLTAVALTNQSFDNSQINYQVELAYAGLTNYAESGNFSTDLARLSNSGDGYMDEVHTLRNEYSADVCVLLINDCDNCGLAQGIGVTAANAFCVVSTCSDCATSYYSFAHEIGHLLGCRHDPYADNNTTPFAYGHGYIPPSKTWRTIMAYDDGCNGCPRLQYWSNPNVTYGGEPMGTIATNNNTRVWNERSTAVMAFKQPDNNVTFTSSYIPSTRYSDVIAKQNITSSGTVNVNGGNTLNMRAGVIVLDSGFSVGADAELSAQNEYVYDCEECASAANKIIVKKIPEGFDDMEYTLNGIHSDFSYTVIPHPSEEYISIEYSLDKDTPFSIELVDLFGQKTKTILAKRNQQAGSYSLDTSVAEISKGTYFLNISSANQTKTEKIIINK